MSDPLPKNPLPSNGDQVQYVGTPPRSNVTPKGTPSSKKDSASIGDYSNLTDDQSLVSRVSSKITSVLGNAGKILTGELPEEVYEDEEDYDPFGIRQSKSPLGLEEPPNAGSTTSSKGEQIDFMKDDPSTMTYSRRIALHLSKKSWYNPRANAEPEFPESQVEDPGDSLRVTNGAGSGGVEEKKKAAATIEAYPFTHSRRENPSLERAWACKYLVKISSVVDS